ncbi:DUF4345 family protein [Cognatishimia sp. F0-27]|uniref:DUF4345 family protein n=1 Tax=Cognatishimia sp. F0-27 TaxID=2816855 RepID=UPI001D0C62B6|nr:DUF4345 family protein [Cognatishimia sp. F0-27]MCC1493582.1 DUF4345 family protein [Cognatishimia sp. F0-27]
MIDWINPALALMTIGFGLFGFLAPRYTASALDLAPQDTTMGLSELRASAGGLFVAVGVVCLATGDPMAYGMLGVAYVGASSGRLLSIILDKPPLRKAVTFLAFEALPAAWLVWTGFFAATT